MSDPHDAQDAPDAPDSQDAPDAPDSQDAPDAWTYGLPLASGPVTVAGGPATGGGADGGADGPEVVRKVTITREELDFDHPTAGREIAEALAELVPDIVGVYRPPLAREIVNVELQGVPTAFANAFRRVLKDELKGRCLSFEIEDFDHELTTDPFMYDADYVRTRVRMIPLRPQISKSIVETLRFSLDVANDSDTVLTVFAGDLAVTAGVLSAPLFNPTHELAFLQPGRELRIENIRIVEGYGNRDAAFIVAVRAAAVPLDLPECDPKETHAKDAPTAQQSGFKVSSLVANPRRHRITASLPAVPAGGDASATVLLDVCANIIQRLRYIRDVLEEGGGDGTATYHSVNAYFVITTGGKNTKGVLSVRNETDTIGVLLARSIYELMPDIGFVAQTCIPHEKMMRLTVCHSVAETSEIGDIIVGAIDFARATFEQIRDEIRAKAYVK
jgi:hypothetical protein